MRGEPSQSLFEYVATEWTDAGNQYVYAKVELQPVDEVRLVQIPLSHVVLSLDQPIAVPREEDASPLAFLLWLDNERFGSLVVELLLEVFGVGWQDPGLWEEVVLVWYDCLHVGQVPCEQILSGNHVSSRQMIDSLVGLHFHDESGLDGPVDPPNVPLVLVFSHHSEVHFLGTFDQLVVVLTIVTVDGESVLMHILRIAILRLAHQFTRGVVLHVKHVLSGHLDARVLLILQTTVLLCDSFLLSRRLLGRLATRFALSLRLWRPFRLLLLDLHVALVPQLLIPDLVDYKLEVIRIPFLLQRHFGISVHGGNGCRMSALPLVHSRTHLSSVRGGLGLECRVG